MTRTTTHFLQAIEHDTALQALIDDADGDLERILRIAARAGHTMSEAELEQAIDAAIAGASAAAGARNAEMAHPIVYLAHPAVYLG